MLCCAWIIFLSLAGTYGDLSFLINRRAETQSVTQNRQGKYMLKRGGHGGHLCDHHQCSVEAMLVNVGQAFDEEHCKAIEHYNCEPTVIPNELICSNEGITYPNHCLFVQASCLLVLDHHNHDKGAIIHSISVKHYGACVVPQSPTTTNTVLSTALGLATATSQQLLTQKTSTTTVAAITNQPSPVPTAATTTNRATSVSTAAAIISQTTTVSTAYILGQTFCAHKSEFICDKSFSVICGSDGNFYPNTCEFSKVQCDNHALVRTESVFCNPQPVEAVG